MILHDHISWFCIFGRFTPTYHTSFFLVFCHNGDSLVHDLHDHFSWFCMTIFHDFAWLSNCWDVHPCIIHHFSDFLSQLLWSRLHPSSCSVIGSMEDRSVLVTIHDIYFNCIGYFEQVLSSKFLENLLFSSSRLHPSSCSVIGSVEDRSVLMTIHDIYFNSVY